MVREISLKNVIVLEKYESGHKKGKKLSSMPQKSLIFLFTLQ